MYSTIARTAVRRTTLNTATRYIRSKNKEHKSVKSNHDDFVKESGFMGEVIRATLMREMGYSNPMSKFINAVVSLDIKDGRSYANFSSDNLIKLLGKDDKKK